MHFDYIRAGSALGAVGVAVRFGKSIGAVQYLSRAAP